MRSWVFRDVLPDTRRGPAGDRLEVVSEPIIAVVGMKLGHGPHVAEDVARQTA
jgi:hypothetical protein